MNIPKIRLGYFSKKELALWGGSTAVILVSFLLFDRANYLTLAASLVGATSLIFNAKGNPVGQALMVVFSVMYGVISWTCAYYGEMITYLGMTGPMAVFALVSWLKNPYGGNRAQVRVSRLKPREPIFMCALAAAVTAIFYFILKAFDTANLALGTFSVTTSFIAVYLTFRRCPGFALAYAANDIVLVILWIIAAMSDSAYISVCVCFVIFLANDIYGFACWRTMEKRQAAGE